MLIFKFNCSITFSSYDANIYIHSLKGKAVIARITEVVNTLLGEKMQNRIQNVCSGELKEGENFAENFAPLLYVLHIFHLWIFHLQTAENMLTVFFL